MRSIVLLLVVAVISTLSACTSTEAKVEQREDLLAASGFTVRPANTPERIAQLHRLPAHRFVQRTKGDKVIYLYSDPLVCACLYIGDQQAYGRYQETVFDRQMARDNRADQAQLQRESRDDYIWDIKAAEVNDPGWDWSPWGPGWW